MKCLQRQTTGQSALLPLASSRSIWYKKELRMRLYTRTWQAIAYLWLLEQLSSCVESKEQRYCCPNYLLAVHLATVLPQDKPEREYQLLSFQCETEPSTPSLACTEGEKIHWRSLVNSTWGTIFTPTTVLTAAYISSLYADLL